MLRNKITVYCAYLDASKNQNIVFPGGGGDLPHPSPRLLLFVLLPAAPQAPPSPPPPSRQRQQQQLPSQQQQPQRQQPLSSPLAHRGEDPGGNGHRRGLLIHHGSHAVKVCSKAFSIFISIIFWCFCRSVNNDEKQAFCKRKQKKLHKRSQKKKQQQQGNSLSIRLVWATTYCIWNHLSFFRRQAREEARPSPRRGLRGPFHHHRRRRLLHQALLLRRRRGKEPRGIVIVLIQRRRQTAAAARVQVAAAAAAAAEPGPSGGLAVGPHLRRGGRAGGMRKYVVSR